MFEQIGRPYELFSQPSRIQRRNAQSLVFYRYSDKGMSSKKSSSVLILVKDRSKIEKRPAIQLKERRLKNSRLTVFVDLGKPVRLVAASVELPANSVIPVPPLPDEAFIKDHVTFGKKW